VNAAWSYLVGPAAGPRAMNTVLFLGAFARLVFPHLQAYDPHHFRQNSVVVLDNARIHVAAMPMLRLLCALKGAKLVSLPPVRLRTAFLGIQRITLTVFVVAVLAGPEPSVCCTAGGLVSVLSHDMPQP